MFIGKSNPIIAMKQRQCCWVQTAICTTASKEERVGLQVNKVNNHECPLQFFIEDEEKVYTLHSLL